VHGLELSLFRRAPGLHAHVQFLDNPPRLVAPHHRQHIRLGLDGLPCYQVPDQRLHTLRWLALDCRDNVEPNGIAVPPAVPRRPDCQARGPDIHLCHTGRSAWPCWHLHRAMSQDRCLPDGIERVLPVFSLAVDQSVVGRTDDETVPQLIERFEGLEDVSLSVKGRNDPRPFLHALEEFADPALSRRPVFAFPPAFLACYARLTLGDLALAPHPDVLVQHAENLVVFHAHRQRGVGQEAACPRAVVDRPETTRAPMFRVAQRGGVLDDQQRGAPEATLHRSVDVPGQDVVMLDLGIREQPVDSFRLMRILRDPGNARRGILNQCRPNANGSFRPRPMSEVGSTELQYRPCGRLKCLHGSQPVDPHRPQRNFLARVPSEAAGVGHSPSFLGKDEPLGRGRCARGRERSERGRWWRCWSRSPRRGQRSR